MSKREKFMMRVVKGGLEPADDFTTRRLREKGYRVNDILAADLRKARNPRFHRLAHVFGQMVADNIEQFTGMEAHAVIKRLQWESGVACDEMGVMLPGGMAGTVRIPRSLSFSEMDEGEFREVFRALARHVAQTYWPDLDEDEIAAMAEVMPAEAV